MPFGISHKTLESLEWPEILARLEERVRTPRARARLRGSGAGGGPGTALFEDGDAGVRERLAETAEALALLAEGPGPPLSGVAELADSLARARKGGALEGPELLRVGATLAALHETSRYLAARQSAAPRLAAAAEAIGDHPALRAELDACLEPGTGELRDEASAALADARRDVRRLAGEIQQRLQRTLQDPAVAASLSDRYYTVRHDRYVLPVRADARGGVRGIVHDASRSGTTLFIEPEALVDLNNRHKQAEIAVEQETWRVLRELSRLVADAADAIASDVEALAGIDLAFARAALARDGGAVCPEVGDAGVISLPQLRHPLIPRDEAVPNDVRLGDGFLVLVLSGPNAGGKTVTMKAVALAVLCARAGLFVAAEAPARVDLFDRVLADIGDDQDIREHLSTFSAHMANVSRIVALADARSLVVLDEIGVGTDPGEGAALAQATLEALAGAGARVLATTHYNLLKELAESDARFANASVEFDPESLAPTYRLRMGLPGSSSATAVAARMGLRRDVLERAEEILSSEDRRLDRMLRELSASRASLEHERREARRLRADSEAARAEYGERLARLEARRSDLYRAMREDLDAAFRDAHAQIATVVRELQRAGAGSRGAAAAREELLELAEGAREAEARAGVAVRTAPAGPPLDWNRARPGDAVLLDGVHAATLVALPDPRGRVAVRVGSARLIVPRERVCRPAGAVAEQPPAPRGGERSAAPLGLGGSSRCDLRGLRVDEALDRLTEALDAAVAEGRDELVVVHGIGTGALRRAVREHLATSPYVARLLAGAPDAGGDGVTSVELAG